MRRLFTEQLVAMREAIRDAIQAQFAKVGLFLEAQDTAAEEEEGELPRASVEDVD